MKHVLFVPLVRTSYTTVTVIAPHVPQATTNQTPGLLIVCSALRILQASLVPLLLTTAFAVPVMKLMEHTAHLVILMNTNL